MLTIVPTPIGNLRDITLRALDTLKEADAIICEDTRQTLKLLNHYEIKKPLVSYHEHASASRLSEIMSRLERGEALALVSDGGTPLLSDPGFEILREAVKRKIPVTSLPGAYAAITALTLSSLAVDRYSFFGFLSQKSASRRKFLESLKEREETLIFYESPYRLLKVLEEMKEIFGGREACVARELTKKFEEVVRGRFSELIEKFSQRKILGEIVILISGKGRKEMFA